MLVLFAAHAAPARAQQPVLWHCWYDADGKFRLTCVLPDDEATGLLRRIYIPLYGPPAADFIQAERLARAVMCRRQPACSVTFDRRVR